MDSFLGSINVIATQGKPFSMPKKAIAEYTNDDELAVIMEHAKKRDLMDYYWQCLHRRCDLKGAESPPGATALERAFNEIMHAYQILRKTLCDLHLAQSQKRPVGKANPGEVGAIEEEGRWLQLRIEARTTRPDGRVFGT